MGGSVTTMRGIVFGIVLAGGIAFVAGQTYLVVEQRAEKQAVRPPILGEIEARLLRSTFDPANPVLLEELSAYKVRFDCAKDVTREVYLPHDDGWHQVPVDNVPELTAAPERLRVEIPLPPRLLSNPGCGYAYRAFWRYACPTGPKGGRSFLFLYSIGPLPFCVQEAP